MAATEQATLLVFTLGPDRERGRRHWLPACYAGLETGVHQRCLDEVLTAGRAAGCALRVSTPDREMGELVADGVTVDRQSGGRFGSRLVAAVARATAEKSGPLIVVGTDTPGIDGDLIGNALATICEQPDTVVLGPAADGGIYLLAAAGDVTDALAEVRWQSSRTLDSLIAALRRSGRRVRLLALRRDLDSRRDLELWIARATIGGAWRSLVGALRRALAALAAVPIAGDVLVPALAWRRAPVGRAPPR